MFYTVFQITLSSGKLLIDSLITLDRNSFLLDKGKYNGEVRTWALCLDYI